MGCASSLLHGHETREMLKGMRTLWAAHGDEEGSSFRELYDATVLADNKSRLNLFARYRGWNALHLAAYKGAGDVVYDLLGESSETVDARLASSTCRPQRASVLMCIAHGVTSAPYNQEDQLEQAGFKLIFLLSDDALRYTDRRGLTALHFAAVHGAATMVEALIERCVDLEARGVMAQFEDGDGHTRDCALRLCPEDDEQDQALRTPLECAVARLDVASRFLPETSNTIQRLRRVIEILQRATGRGEPPAPPSTGEQLPVVEGLVMGVPLIDRMLTFATVPAGQEMVVATPKGLYNVVVPPGCNVGVYFQFDLPEPIPVADFHAWPRPIATGTAMAAAAD
jgi:hypothetical protein